MSTALGDSGDFAINKNLIKSSIKPAKMDIGVDELKSPTVKEKDAKNVEIHTKENVSEIEEVKEETNKEVKVEVVEKPPEKIFNKKEVVSGFEEVKQQIKNLYDTIFGYGDNFKPTYQDTLGDFLSYLGGISYKLGAEKNFFEVFGVNVNTLNDRYYSVSYIPYAVKIAVWAYKNKGKNNVYEILNGIVRSAYAFGYKIPEKDLEDKVFKTILSVVDFIRNNDISIN